MKNILLFTVFIVLGLTSLFGVIIPDNLPVRSVGYFQLAPFRDGLSLYQSQDVKRYTYSVSPLNDYYISSAGERQNLISRKDLEDKRYTVSLDEKSKWENILSAIAGYFNLDSPSIKYSGPYKVSYTSNIDQGKLSITRSLEYGQVSMGETIGTTLSYYSGDFIFDPDGNLYTYQSQEDMDLFKKLYGINLIPEYEELRIPVVGKTVFIMNPDIAGVIKIIASSDQQVWINRQLRLIELEQKTSSQNDFMTSLTLEIVDNPSLAKVNL